MSPSVPTLFSYANAVAKGMETSTRQLVRLFGLDGNILTIHTFIYFVFILNVTTLN